VQEWKTGCLLKQKRSTKRVSKTKWLINADQPFFV